MYSRFKDDIFISALDVEKGTKLVDGQIIIDMEKKMQMMMLQWMLLDRLQKV